MYIERSPFCIIPLENRTLRLIFLPSPRNSRTVKKDVSIIKVLQAIYKQSRGLNSKTILRYWASLSSSYRDTKVNARHQFRYYSAPTQTLSPYAC